MSQTALIAQVALPTPLHQTFSYQASSDVLPGCRVQVPFGKTQLPGLVIRIEAYHAEQHKLELENIKPIATLIDTKPLLDQHCLQLSLWLNDYYQHPIGDTIIQLLPTLLRQGAKAEKTINKHYQLSQQGLLLIQNQSELEPLQRKAPQQARILQALETDCLTHQTLKQKKLSYSALKTLLNKKLIEQLNHAPELESPVNQLLKQTPLPLNNEQSQALEHISQRLNQFQVFLLNGITGSGKTEVYLQAIEKVLQQQQQCLVLVPEIGLTPQTLQRFSKRFNVHSVSLHSELSPRQRLDNWLDCQSGKARIIIGTRSACLYPFAKLGLIIIDEEHDLSFKQQDGLKYNARDVAVKRASMLDIPVVLGSATPSLESLHNSQIQKYQPLQLQQRAGKSRPPIIRLLDIRQQTLQEGISKSLLDSLRQNIEQGQQSLVFINRRGFSPALICADCGWCPQCPQCDMRLTSHKDVGLLRCHHCGYENQMPFHCGDCFSQNIEFVGQGTQRLESFLSQQFNVPVIRIDKDNTQNQAHFEQALKPVYQGQPCILIGTQMLAKGHHFPNITLVGIVDADAGLYSADFRAPERFGQLLLQVAGRAGREEKQGLVLIQTHLPEHPLLNKLTRQNYLDYAQQLLLQRQQQALPPFTHIALLRADHPHNDKVQRFLQQIRQQLTPLLQHALPSAKLWGPSPAALARRAGRYRWQLHLHCISRQQRAQACQLLLKACLQHRQQQQLRWSLDIDPQETA